jgi:hypothetical protein
LNNPTKFVSNWPCGIREEKLKQTIPFFHNFELLVGMFITVMFFVVDRMYTKETIDPEVQKGCCLFLIFFSEFTGLIGPKVGRNVH